MHSRSIPGRSNTLVSERVLRAGCRGCAKHVKIKSVKSRIITSKRLIYRWRSQVQVGMIGQNL